MRGGESGRHEGGGEVVGATGVRGGRVVGATGVRGGGGGGEEW